MKLFINDGVCGRKGCNKIKETGYDSLELLIPNIATDEGKETYIKFLFHTPMIKEKNFKKDLLLNNISFNEISQNVYDIRKSNKSEEKCMYALIRSNEVVPDDVFIQETKKDKIKVLKKIHFVDGETDYGDFLSNLYLLEIKLDVGESIPIYLAGKNSKSFSRY